MKVLQKFIFTVMIVLSLTMYVYASDGIPFSLEQIGSLKKMGFIDMGCGLYVRDNPSYIASHPNCSTYFEGYYKVIVDHSEISRAPSDVSSLSLDYLNSIKKTGHIYIGDYLYHLDDSSSPSYGENFANLGSWFHKIIELVKEKGCEYFTQHRKEVIENEIIFNFQKYEGELGAIWGQPTYYFSIILSKC